MCSLCAARIAATTFASGTASGPGAMSTDFAFAWFQTTMSVIASTCWRFFRLRSVVATLAGS